MSMMPLDWCGGAHDNVSYDPPPASIERHLLPDVLPKDVDKLFPAGSLGDVRRSAMYCTNLKMPILRLMLQASR